MTPLPKQYRVTRFVHHDEPYNYLERDVEPGEILTRYTGPTFGAVDLDNGVVVETSRGIFAEFPASAVEAVP